MGKYQCVIVYYTFIILSHTIYPLKHDFDPRVKTKIRKLHFGHNNKYNRSAIVLRVNELRISNYS